MERIGFFGRRRERAAREREERAKYDQFAPLRQAKEALPVIIGETYKAELAANKAQVREGLHNYLSAMTPHLPDVVCIKEGSVPEEKQGMSFIPFPSPSGVAITLNLPSPSEYYLPQTKKVVIIDPEMNKRQGYMGHDETPTEYFPSDPNFIGFDELQKVTGPEVTFKSVDDYIDDKVGQGIVFHFLNDKNFADRVKLELKKSSKTDPELKKERNAFNQEITNYKDKVNALHTAAAPNMQKAVENATQEVEDTYYGKECLPEYHFVNNIEGLFYLPRERRLIHPQSVDRSDWRRPIPDIETARDATPLEWYNNGYQVVLDLMGTVVAESDRTLLYPRADLDKSKLSWLKRRR